MEITCVGMPFRVGFICGKESDVVEEPQVLLPLEFVSGTFYLGAFLLFTGGWRRSTGFILFPMS